MVRCTSRNLTLTGLVSVGSAGYQQKRVPVRVPVRFMFTVTTTILVIGWGYWYAQIIDWDSGRLTRRVRVGVGVGVRVMLLSGLPGHFSSDLNFDIRYAFGLVLGLG